MTTPRSGDLLTAGPIQWPVDSPCGANGPDDITNPAIWPRAVQIATEWVWALSGRRYGLSTVVFRPEWTIPERMPGRLVMNGPSWPGIFPTWPLRTNQPLTRAPLPGPVDSVTQVLVDNVALAGSGAAYLVEQDWIVRIDGGQWYRFQNNALPTTSVGTWQITYVRGLEVPAGGEFAVGSLACELAKQMCGEKCRLPNNTSTVTRNGVTVNLDAKQPQLGFTGLTEVDQWCRIVNPKGRPSDSIVWTPDLDSTRLPQIPTNV